MGGERIEFEGVEGLRVGRFGSHLNTTCILYRLGSLVVDTGPPNQWPTVRGFLRERAVDRVIVTHHHEDHSGNLGAIDAELNAEVCAPAAGVEPLAEGFRLRGYQRIVWGTPGPVRSRPLPDTIPLADGGALRPLPAPGHSADMTCFFEPSRGWLFSGDLYIASRTRYLRADESVGDTIESLRQMLELDFGTLFCSHRGPISSGKEALRRKLAFLEELCGRVAELHARNRSEKEIARELLGREDWMRWVSFGHFSKRNLVLGCLDEAVGTSRGGS